MPSESEDYLVRQAIGRDRSAFASLYESCVDKVYRHVYYRVSNQDEAQDITQEVFVRAWKSIDRYKNTGAPFISWLTKIASNLITDFYRNRQKLIKRDEKLTKDLILSQNDVEDHKEIYFDDSLVKEAVLKLKGDKHKVILMHFIDGLSCEEIAKALNKSESNIRVIQYRALADLKRLLGLK